MRREVSTLAAGLVAVTAVTGLLRWLPGINPATAGFTLLLIVLTIATFGRLWTAIATAVFATLLFNYHFFPPIGTLAIAEPHNWVSLVAFLVSAIVASKLSATARAHELIRQRAELAATLLASLSHDLKTPLTVLRVAVDNLRGDLPADARRAQADAAATELSRLTRLFEGILDMARIDAAAIRVQREWVTPADIVDAALAHARHAIDGHAIRVEAGTDRAIHVDARLAAVALSHLIENAARYSPADRDILVSARAEDEGMTVTVSDQGPGIDPADREHLFERFYRGRGSQQNTAGTGMGLAITRGLLNAIGGRVWADDGVASGARFSMRLPGATRRAGMDA